MQFSGGTRRDRSEPADNLKSYQINFNKKSVHILLINDNRIIDQVAPFGGQPFVRSGGKVDECRRGRVLVWPGSTLPILVQASTKSGSLFNCHWWRWRSCAVRTGVAAGTGSKMSGLIWQPGHGACKMATVVVLRARVPRGSSSPPPEHQFWWWLRMLRDHNDARDYE